MNSLQELALLKREGALSVMQLARVQMQIFHDAEQIWKKPQSDKREEVIRSFGSNEWVHELFPHEYSEQQKSVFLEDVLSVANSLERMDGVPLHSVHEVAVESLKQPCNEISLQAYALQCGYRFEDVFALTPDEVGEHFRAALRALPDQLSWEMLGRVSKDDVDKELLGHLLGDPSMVVERRNTEHDNA